MYSKQNITATHGDQHNHYNHYLGMKELRHNEVTLVEKGEASPALLTRTSLVIELRGVVRLHGLRGEGAVRRSGLSLEGASALMLNVKE